jgi:putative DNA primase/helicase
VSGSLAFGALARIVLATAKINDGGTYKRIVCRAKSNIGLDHGGFEYDLHQKEIEGHKGVFGSYAVWGEQVEGSARELLTEHDPEKDEDEVSTAAQFLRDELADGRKPQKEIEAECKGAGYSVATIRRAKKKLGIKSIKDKFEGGWYWSLPDQFHEDAHEDVEGAHQNRVSTLGKFEHLGQKNLDKEASDADAWEV